MISLVEQGQQQQSSGVAFNADVGGSGLPDVLCLDGKGANVEIVEHGEGHEPLRKTAECAEANSSDAPLSLGTDRMDTAPELEEGSISLGHGDPQDVKLSSPADNRKGLLENFRGAISDSLGKSAPHQRIASGQSLNDLMEERVKSEQQAEFDDPEACSPTCSQPVRRAPAHQILSGFLDENVQSDCAILSTQHVAAAAAAASSAAEVVQGERSYQGLYKRRRGQFLINDYVLNHHPWFQGNRYLRQHAVHYPNKIMKR